jgi:hypothetical protein
VSTVGKDEALVREYPKPRRGRQATRPNEFVVASGHRKVAAQDGAALATPNSRFERLTT